MGLRMMGLRAFLVRLCLQSNMPSKWNRGSRGKRKAPHCAGVTLVRSSGVLRLFFPSIGYKHKEVLGSK